MNKPSDTLLRHLVLAVLLKLAVLMGLWWVFVREQRVPVDTDSTAAQLELQAATTAPTPPGESNRGEPR
jgi:hypothetical protein